MTLLTNENERSLAERAKSGDRIAMKQIYDCYANYLAATCSRFLPDKAEMKDVLQDSFIKIFSSLDKFTFRGEGSLKAWMRQVVVNESLKVLRRKRSKVGSAISYTWDQPDVEDESDSESDIENVPTDVLQEMIEALPDGYRTVLNLYAFEQKSHKEIASLLGITESTSASQLHRARAILMKEINEYKSKKGDAI